MPRSKRGDGGGGDDIRREEGLQAVLLADSFTQTFRPITYEVPKVLLPLVNAPMLEYTLELLANSGVVEVPCPSTLRWRLALTHNCAHPNTGHCVLLQQGTHGGRLSTEVQVDCGCHQPGR